MPAKATRRESPIKVVRWKAPDSNVDALIVSTGNHKVRVEGVLIMDCTVLHMIYDVHMKQLVLIRAFDVIYMTLSG